MMHATPVGLVAVLVCVTAFGAQYEEKTLSSFELGADGWTAGGGATSTTASEHATDGRGALKVHFARAQSHIAKRGGMDLSGWDKIKFDVHNAGEPFNVTLRATDGQGRSYTCWYQRLARGASTIEYSLRGFASKVPEKGKVSGLDLANITSINIRVDQKLPKAADVWFDNFRLTRGAEPFVKPKAAGGGKPVVEVPGNILTNPDFELGLQGWSSWGQWDGGRYKFGGGRGEYAHTGASSAEIICVKPGRGGIFTGKMPVKNGTTYKLTFWARGKGGAKLQLTTVGRVGPVPERWKKYEYDIPMRSNEYRLYIYNVGPGSLFIDTVSLVPPGAASAAGESVADGKPSKVTLKGDRAFVNGRPFFPVGIYGVRDPKREFEGTGFNFAFGGATTRSSSGWFTACHEAGVMTIAGLSGLMRGHMGSQAPSIAKKVKESSALFGYYICDEPDHGGWNVTPSEIRQAHRLLKKADPDHPTIVLVMAWHRSMAYQYADTADIIASDPYHLTDMDKPVRSTLWMDDGQAKKQPVWTVLQAGWDQTAPPRPEAIVGQAYSSVACGADGIFWFELQWCKRHRQQWEAIRKVSLELKEIHDDLCGEECTEQPAFSDKRIIGIAKEAPRGQGTLLVAVNKTLDNVGEVEITVPGLRGAGANELFGGGRVRFSGGRLKATFGPGQRRVYRILHRR